MSLLFSSRYSSRILQPLSFLDCPSLVSLTNDLFSSLPKGGMNFLPQKHKSGLRVNYNSGFFITTNVYPDFGNQADCDAIRKRLAVFETCSLKRKDPSVSGKFSF